MAKKQKEAREKPLEKMTATELRDMAKEIPEITGASGMNKSELIAAIKDAKGITEKGGRKGPAATVRQMKEKIRELRQRREEYIREGNKKMSEVYRRRISRQKKMTRRIA